jgi:hypothetical protein
MRCRLTRQPLRTRAGTRDDVGLDATGLPALAQATMGKLPTIGLLHGLGTLAAFGRTRTLNAAAYCALVSGILAGQGQVGR